MSWRRRLIVISIGQLLYLAALCLPGHAFDVLGNGPMTGWECLRSGAVDLLDCLRGVEQSWYLATIWLANPALWLSWTATACGYPRIAMGLATVALVLTWVFFGFGIVTIGSTGYWCWSLSCLWTTLALLPTALKPPHDDREPARTTGGTP